jgi:hypothetical protein
MKKNMKDCTIVNYQHFTAKIINSLIIISYYCIHKEKINYLTTEKHEKNYFFNSSDAFFFSIECSNIGFAKF